MKKKIAIVAAAILSASGCTIPMNYAKTPDEFRQQVRTGYPQEFHTLEVNRPVEQVGESFKRKARECLNFEVKDKYVGGISIGSDTITESINKSYVTKSGRKYTLVLRSYFPGNHAEQPKEGYYNLVADAHAISANKTKVDIYTGLSPTYVQAVSSWAQGDERGCPDPLRMYKK